MPLPCMKYIHVVSLVVTHNQIIRLHCYLLLNQMSMYMFQVWEFALDCALHFRAFAFLEMLERDLINLDNLCLIKDLE
ncbi:hypothetical protein KFK09_002443 [Dendrobium nobile]|uniref:Uncharacterized protein n=1 Tax=Dendrobium nobile TaxID=94219 RepID=A0A8T3C1E5_DENNO|nr:hypothetical protein KFK09_002443 [Dendrobium nobile]